MLSHDIKMISFFFFFFIFFFFFLRILLSKLTFLSLLLTMAIKLYKYSIIFTKEFMEICTLFGLESSEKIYNY